MLRCRSPAVPLQLAGLAPGHAHRESIRAGADEQDGEMSRIAAASSGRDFTSTMPAVGGAGLRGAR